MQPELGIKMDKGILAFALLVFGFALWFLVSDGLLFGWFLLCIWCFLIAYCVYVDTENYHQENRGFEGENKSTRKLP
jgi:membrane protein required for beta-lactamase induction